MANEIISQATQEIKKQGLDGVVSQLRESPRDIDHLAAEILSGTNEKALDYLSMFGVRSFLEGTEFCPAATLAEFFGVNPGYLMRMLNAHGISHTKTPDDVKPVKDISLDGYDVTYERQVEPGINRMCTVFRSIKRYRGGHFFSGYAGGSPIAIVAPLCQGVQRVPCVSAKVALASVPLMYYGRKIPDRSMAETVLNALRGSSYYRQAEARALGYEEKPESQTASSAVQGARINDAGEIVFSPEFFTLLLKNFGQEIAGAIRDAAKNAG